MADRDYGYDRDRYRDSDERGSAYDRNRDTGREWNDRNRGPNDRGAMSRGADEVRSWFGDDEARRRREMDERRDREHDRFRDDRGWSERGYSGGTRNRSTADDWSRGERGDSSSREWGGERNPGWSESGWQSGETGRRDYGSSGQYGGGSYNRDFSGRGDFGANRGGDFSGSRGTDRGDGASRDFDRNYGGSSSWSGSNYAGAGANVTYGSGYSRDNFSGSGEPSRYGRDWSNTGGQSSGYGGQSWRESGSHAGRGPRNFQRSDERIREDVVQRLTDDPRVDASDIDVEVRNGEVFLRGHVDERRTRRAAEECIEDLPGVRDVKNELQVEKNRDRDRDRHEDWRVRDGGIGHTGNPEVRDDATSLNVTGPQSEAANAAKKK